MNDLKTARILNARGLWAKDKGDFPEEVRVIIDKESPVQSTMTVFDEVRRQVKNLWILDEGDKMTGLVHPETREEAEFEIERIGKSGTLHLRENFEGSDRWVEFFLPQDRQQTKAELRKNANTALKGRLGVLEQMVELGLTVPENSLKVIQELSERQLWCDTATKAELDAYDPGF